MEKLYIPKGDFMKIFVFLASLFYLTSIFAGTIDPNVPDQKYIEYGSKFKNVVQIKGICRCKQEPKEHKFSASAVVIKPNWILTAAHVVHDTSDAEIVVNDKIFPVEVFIHEEFNDNQYGHNDIAVCYSKENIVMDFYPELYTEQDEVGKVVSLAGLGITGNFHTGSSFSDGKKRAGSNIIARTERSVLVCSLTDKRTSLEFLISHGDSGGGLFIGNKLAGIHSFVMADDHKPNSSYGDESGHTRICLYYDWILKKIK